MHGKLPGAARIAILAALTAPFAKPASIYNFSSFDGPGLNGGGTTVDGISNNGYITGFSSDNAVAPTLFTNFVLAPNGILTALSINRDPLAIANGINDANTVVGSSNNQAFVQTGSATAILPPVDGTSVSQTAFGINDQSVIVGQYTESLTDTQPGFLYNGSAYTILNPVITALAVNAQSVNNQGEVMGFYSTDGVHQHGFFFNDVSDSYQLPADPSISNLVLTQFLGINDKGMAVGYYQTTDGSQHGFIYDLANSSYSFLDDPNAALSGVSITQVTGINDANEITGFYVDATTGRQRGFYATVAAPEPGTMLLSAGACLMLFVIRLRRRRIGAG